MADTLTVPVERILAVLQECPGISALERDGIVARLRIHNVAPAVAPGTRPELISTYVMVNFEEDTWTSVPEPTARNEFRVIECSLDSLVPYEFQHGVTFPHLVVVTACVEDASRFFEFLMSRNGLTITALEFLIHCSSYDEEYELADVHAELAGTPLQNWVGNSQSIKILADSTFIDYELFRHARFVVENNTLDNLRGLSDTDRAPIHHRRAIHGNEENDGNRRERRRRRRNNRERQSRSRSPN